MNTTPDTNSPDPSLSPLNSGPGSAPGADVSWWAAHKKWILITAAVIFVLGLGGLLALGGPKEKDNGKSQANTDKSQQMSSKPDASRTPGFMTQYGEVCKDRPASLTASPVPLAQLGYIEPLGKVSDGHVTPTDHMYIAPKNTRAADNTTDVVMPGDGTIIDVSAMPSQYIGDKQQQTAAEDHRIVVSHSCRYFSIFIHVHKLSNALAAAVGTLQPNTSKRVSVDLKAGELIGKIGGNPVDWTFVDTSKKLAGFINPDLYASEPWKVHTTDPFNVYTGDLKAKMEAASLRSKAPVGGKIDYDVKGALVGNWFREGTKGYSGTDQSRYWDGHLAIAPDFIDGTTGVVSIGNWEGKAAQYAVKGAFDAAKITKANGPVKVELMGRSYVLPNGMQWTGNETPTKGITVMPNAQTVGTIMFEVQDGEKLKVERFVGKTPAQVSAFTAAAQVYTR